jgi:hypothetical protein
MFQLEHIKFESCQRAERLIRGVFERKLDMVVSTGPGSVRYLQDRTLDLRIGLRQEMHPDVCVNPITVLDLLYTTPSRSDSGMDYPPPMDWRN